MASPDAHVQITVDTEQLEAALERVRELTEELDLERRMRTIAREEVASLCGLLLRRIGELEAETIDAGDFGGTTTEPGT